MPQLLPRRSILAAALPAAAAVAFRGAGAVAREVRDSAGRSAALPDHVSRVLPAGPPAAILLWSVAPELLAGWVRRPSPAELAFLPPEAAALPEVGRLTGRGGTANTEAVLAQHPDLVIDYGSLGPSYVSLADAVQAQTKLPYLLLDGALARLPAT